MSCCQINSNMFKRQSNSNSNCLTCLAFMSEHQFRANFCPSLKKIVQPKFKKFVIFFTKSNWLKFLRFFLKGLMSIIFNNFILSIIGRPSCVKKCAKYRFKIHAIIVGFLQTQYIAQISMLVRDESLSMNVML